MRNLDLGQMVHKSAPFMHRPHQKRRFRGTSWGRPSPRSRRLTVGLTKINAVISASVIHNISDRYAHVTPEDAMSKLEIPHDAFVLVGDGHKALFLRNAGDAKFPDLRIE